MSEPGNIMVLYDNDDKQKTLEGIYFYSKWSGNVTAWTVREIIRDTKENIGFAPKLSKYIAKYLDREIFTYPCGNVPDNTGIIDPYDKRVGFARVSEGKSLNDTNVQEYPDKWYTYDEILNMSDEEFNELAESYGYWEI